jgi:tetratricopeptide (TPR) repeat protein
VPTEALALYSRALLYQDRGDKQRAIEYYTKAVSAFPDYAEAKEGLRELRGG